MSDFKNVAIDVVKEAGEILLELAKTTVNYQMKNSRDIQAEADIRSEEIILHTSKIGAKTLRY